MNRLIDKIRYVGLIALVGATMAACQPGSGAGLVAADAGNDGIVETLCKPPELEDFERFVENKESPPPIEQFLWYRRWGEQVPGVDFDPLLLIRANPGPGRRLDLLVQSGSSSGCAIARNQPLTILNRGEDGAIAEIGALLEVFPSPGAYTTGMEDIRVTTDNGIELFYTKR
jgi:hypothetical protein